MSSVSRQLSFIVEREIEILCEVVSYYKGKPSVPEYPEPREDALEVQDLYVGVIIKGTSIDITHLLSKAQIVHLEELCVEEYRSGP